MGQPEPARISDDVEPHGKTRKIGITHQPIIRSVSNAMLTGWRDRINRTAGAGSAFDFHDCQNVSPAANHIDLPGLAAKVASENTITLKAQKDGCFGL